MIHLKNTLRRLTAALLLAMSLAGLAGVLGISGFAMRGPDSAWQEAYAQILRKDAADYHLAFGETRKYAFADLDQDGAPELYACTRSAEGTRDHKLYACFDGKPQTFAGNPRPVSAYRDTETGALLWVCRDERGLTEFTFSFAARRCVDSRIFEYRPADGDGRGAWFIGGEEVSQKKYGREYERWENGHGLVMEPIDLDALLPDAQARALFLETGELDAGALLAGMKIAPWEAKRGANARTWLLWGGAALGAGACATGAILLIVKTRACKRQGRWWDGA